MPTDSGSLTGHILQQGRPDQTGSVSRRNRTVVIVLVIVGVLALLGVAGAVLVFSGRLL